MDQATTCYADCFSGVSGDMLLGALLASGFSEALLREELDKLNLSGLTVEVKDSTSESIGCKKVTISGKEKQQLRTLPVILQVLNDSGLSQEIVQGSIEVFRALAQAEAKVHQIPMERVHFHEIGALDTIADIVGVVAGLHHLGIERFICSPLPLGRGFVNCDHGRLPLPAPAVCELLSGVQTYGVEIDKELVTPTGAALVSVLADSFGPIPPMTISSCGYGGGNHLLPEKQPNVLRLLIGNSSEVKETQQVVVIETRLDDWNSEGFPHLCTTLLSQGALDVNLCPSQGKKGRPGYSLQVLGPLHLLTRLQDTILSETTAIGLRFRMEQRRTLPRETVEIETEWGKLTAKKVHTPQGEVVYPEYEECLRIAEHNKVPLDRVYRAIYAKG